MSELALFGAQTLRRPKDAYMALALCNAQGELHPLEEGLHALGSGLSKAEYATKVGKGETTIQDRRQAAAIANSCGRICDRMN
jgi:hypothetical protein